MCIREAALAVPEEWGHPDTSGIREPMQRPLSSGKGRPLLARVSRGFLGRLRCLGEPARVPPVREVRALGLDGDLGQQLPSQGPQGAAQGPTGFSQ